MFTAGERDFLNRHSLCRLATVSRELVPHNVPVGYAFDGEYLYITTDPGAKKLRNIQENRNVCLVIDEPQKPRKAIMVQGEAELIEGGPQFQEAMDIIARSRGWKLRREGEQVVIKIAPKTKVSWGLD